MQEETAFVKNRITRNTKSLLSDGGVTPQHKQTKLGTHYGLQISLFERPAFHDMVIAHNPSDLSKQAGVLVLARAPLVGSNGASRSVSTVSVNPAFKRKGIGLKLYELSLKHFGALISSSDLSVGSAMLWKTLVEKYEGHLIVPLVKNYQVQSSVNVGITGWSEVSSFWWPKVSVSGKSVSLQKLLTSADPSEQSSARASTYFVKA
jgi:hypothetical protein